MNEIHNPWSYSEKIGIFLKEEKKLKENFKVKTTFAFSEANLKAVSLPIPLLEPVISITLFFIAEFLLRFVESPRGTIA